MSPLARGHCVELILSDGRRIRGEITDRMSPTSWLILGTDGHPYEGNDIDLQRLSGSVARSVQQHTKTLLLRRDIQNILHAVLSPQEYRPKPRTMPDRKTRWGGWDGPPGYGERPEPQRLNADGQTIRPSPRSHPSEIPYELHKYDEWAGIGYGCGLEWTPEFERYIDWSTSRYENALWEMFKIDPRLKAVYILCVERGHAASHVAAELGISRITVWRLRVESERIMGTRRKRLAS